MLKTEEALKKLKEKEITEKKLKEEVEKLKKAASHVDELFQAKAVLQAKYDEAVSSKGADARVEELQS